MSELHQDPVSGDWTIVSPGRAKRPEQLIKKREKRKSTPAKDCPFEDLEKSGNWPPIALFPGKNWKISVIENKYPALTHIAGCSMDIPQGMYKAKTGVGNHELVVTRDHNKNLADLTPKEAKDLFTMLQSRHEVLGADPCNVYVSSFCNWGREAGASLWHPHYQILALPIVPPHASKSTGGAAQYWRKYHRCVRCEIVKAELKEKKRLVAENSSAIVIVPFAAKRPFEVAILPKRHAAHFGKTPAKVVGDVALLLQLVMRQMKKHLHDPDLNFFIHDAPTDGRDYSYHHWHVGVVPVNVVSPPGGFEVSTVVNINVVSPDNAAAILRGDRV